MSYALVAQTLTQPLPPARRAVMLILADMANQAGLCWPSVSTLAHKCCLSVRSVYNHLKALESAGLLVRRARTGRSSVYSLAVTGDPQPEAAEGACREAQTSLPPPSEQATPAAMPQPAPIPQPEGTTHATPHAMAPLTVNSVVDAMRSAGLPGAYDCPALVDLVQTAADASEFIDAATHAVQRKKGFAWALARVAGRRRDAAAGHSGSRPPYMRPADVARATVPGRRGRDPVLKQIEAESAQAAPPSPTIRQRLAQLRAAFASNAGVPATKGAD